jgi:pSer/pThr/pTyr-binding forkhead associated (FHA) protein
MKLSLIVADGVHQGKIIPVPVANFVIGRDPSCQLRPASPAVSKQHCAFITQGGKVTLKDFGSTNGTLLNDERIVGQVELKDGDRIQIGPLAFTIRIEATVPPPSKPKTPANPTKVPNPSSSVDTGEMVAASTPTVPGTVEPAPTPPSTVHEDDQMAAILLGLDDPSTNPTALPEIPEGSTVMELPALPGDPTATPKKDEKKPDPTKANTSKAADDILRKYRERPRN